jgi:hypothetical protein
MKHPPWEWDLYNAAMEEYWRVTQTMNTVDWAHYPFPHRPDENDGPKVRRREFEEEEEVSDEALTRCCPACHMRRWRCVCIPRCVSRLRQFVKK